MMSCTTLAAWSRIVSSPCYTEHGQRCGAVLSDRITTVAMFRNGQLSLRCIVELNCSGMSARLADASVTCDCALDTCELGCVSGAARPFFISVVYSLLWPWVRGSTGAILSERRDQGHVAATEPTSTGR
jgi:hypothetical protein